MTDPQVARACRVAVAWLIFVGETQMASRLSERWEWYEDNQGERSPFLEDLEDPRVEDVEDVIPDEG